MINESNFTVMSQLFDRVIFESNRFLYVLFAQDGTILRCNKGFRTLMNTNSDLTGLSVTSFLSNEQHDIQAIMKDKSASLQFLPHGGNPLTIRCYFYAMEENNILISEELGNSSNTILNSMSKITNDLTNLSRQLQRKNKELEKAQKEIKVLSGFIPICSYCKKIRDDQGYWNRLEKYLTEHSEAQFSHSICPKCKDEFFSVPEKT